MLGAVRHRPSSTYGSADRVLFAERVVEMHRALHAADVVHAYGGAIALAYAVHEPRATIDLDLNIATPVEQATAVLRALPAGVRWTDDDLNTIAADGQVRLWWDTTPVDLFFPQHLFHSVVASRVRDVPFADTVIPVITPTDLVVFKALFNRTKDWADIEAVIRAGTADIDEAQGWVAAIAGKDSPSLTHLASLADLSGDNAAPDPTAAALFRRCGAPTAAGTPCQNRAGSCPHHDKK
jgi:hypothetical protein